VDQAAINAGFDFGRWAAAVERRANREIEKVPATPPRQQS